MKWTVQRYVLREVVQTWLAVTAFWSRFWYRISYRGCSARPLSNQYGRGVVFDLIALGAMMNLSVIVPVGLLLGSGLDPRPHVPR